MYEESTDQAEEFVQKQIEEAIQVAEKTAGKALDYKKLKEVTRLAKEASYLWLQVMETGRAVPAPITAFDEFIHMAPIVEMRGETFTVDYYRALLAELKERIKKGMGAIKDEKKRLIWDNLPVWFRISKMSKRLARHKVALVASTYTNAWGELAEMIDPERPVESAAKLYMYPILNRSTGHKLKVMKQMIKDYHADGVILHSDRSCKPYSIGQMDQHNEVVRKVGVPSLLLEADHNDPRVFTDEQADARIAPFLELLGV